MAKGKRKPPRGKGKGSDFERAFAKELSEWWTSYRRDDVFWRTAMSGGRATVRRLLGQDTYGQAGDIACTDPAGTPLLETVVFELKRGYNTVSLGDLVDSRQNNGWRQLDQWIVQAERSMEEAKAAFWMIVHKRDNRETVCITPYTFMDWLKTKGVVIRKFRPALRAHVHVRTTKDPTSEVYMGLDQYRLSDFFDIVPPKVFL